MEMGSRPRFVPIPVVVKWSVFLLNSNDSHLWSPHRDIFVEQFCENLFWTSDQFISAEKTQALLSWAKESEGLGLFRPAAIGKGAQKKQISDIRSDQIHWLTEFTSNSGQMVHGLFDELQLIARQDLYLPAKRFECHFAKYENGTFYKRHRDRHVNKPGRLLTCVIYLTSCSEAEGGQLLLWDKHSIEHVIRPESGRVVVFDSSLEHEVAKSLTDRWSLVGWIRSDLDPAIHI